MTEEEKKERRKAYMREYLAKYRKEHKEELQLYNHKYKQERREHFNAYNRVYNAVHREHLTECARENRKKYIQPLVYLYRDPDNEIVYIGCTKNLYNRIATRKCKRNHLFDTLYRENPELYTLEVVKEFDTLKEAHAYERKLIEELHPKYNVEFNR